MSLRQLRLPRPYYHIRSFLLMGRSGQGVSEQGAGQAHRLSRGAYASNEQRSQASDHQRTG